jgi:hypothetical protein
LWTAYTIQSLMADDKLRKDVEGNGQGLF